jgi:hypothetical protein
VFSLAQTSLQLGISVGILLKPKLLDLQADAGMPSPPNGNVDPSQPSRVELVLA